MKRCILALVFVLSPPLWAQTAPEYNATGVEHYNAKRWAEAVAAFEAAYQQSPDHPTVRRNLSNAYQAVADEHARRQDLGPAIDYLNLAVSVDPEQWHGFASGMEPYRLTMLGSVIDYLRLFYENDLAFLRQFA